jgi:hypothetical protein
VGVAGTGAFCSFVEAAFLRRSLTIEVMRKHEGDANGVCCMSLMIVVCGGRMQGTLNEISLCEDGALGIDQQAEVV